jgi:formamidopyrimidine-DNA glycosylase
MPELPELEVVQEILNRKLNGKIIASVDVDPKGGPIVIRDQLGKGFVDTLVGLSIQRVDRRGKFLIFYFDNSEVLLVANPKLTGRFQLALQGEKKAGPVQVVLHIAAEMLELRYVDQKRMGQLYLTDSLARIPSFSEMGPSPLDIPLEEFRQRIRSSRGEIKGILTRGRFLSGIGNAYADEILWAAKIHPFRKRHELSREEIDRLHQAVVETLEDSIRLVREAMGEEIHRKPRDFFSVHMQGGEPCPRCGTRISNITAQQRITNFCRNCQPGGLFRGM